MSSNVYIFLYERRKTMEVKTTIMAVVGVITVSYVIGYCVGYTRELNRNR
jgi:hypothetical protein